MSDTIETGKTEVLGPVKIVKSLSGANPINEGPIKNWAAAEQKLRRESYTEISHGVWERDAGAEGLKFHAEIRDIKDPR